MSFEPPSKLVNVSDEADVRIIRLLLNNNDAAAAALADWQRGDMASLLNRLPLQKLPDMIMTDSVVDAVSVVALTSKWIDGTAVTEHFQYVRRLAEVWKSSLELSLALYDARSDPNERIHVLVSNLLSHPQAMTGNSPIKKMLLLLDDDGSSATPLDELLMDSFTETKRQAYRAAADAFKSSSSSSSSDGIMEHAQKYLLKLIKTYQVGEPIDDMAITAAREVAINAIRDPVSLFHEQRDLLSNPAIQALRQDSPALFGMLEVVQTGTLADFESFLKRNGGQQLPFPGTDMETIRQHMRTLTLCSLAVHREELGYDEIAKDLGTAGTGTGSDANDDATVESWIIAAVASGLVSAKMDQLQRTVLVERCAIRGPCQWKALQKQLHAWKAHVGDILQTYRTATVAQGKQQQQQQQLMMAGGAE